MRASVALREAFSFQARACGGLGSPFMEQLLPRLLPAIPEGTPLAFRLNAWDAATLGPAQDSVPLRLAGALHHLHLAGLAPALSAVYPPHSASDAALDAALEDTFAQHGAAISEQLGSPPQTNEVRRAAILIATGHWLTARYELPLRVSEIGASAGLNLCWDQFALEAAGQRLGPKGSPVSLAPEWRGPPPTVAEPKIIEARGVDLRPIHVHDPAEALRLQSYLWPDQTDRLERTRAAIALFLTPESIAQLDVGDALAWLPKRLPHTPGALHMLYSTIAWQYLPEAARAEGAAMIAAAGRTASAEAPLAWLRMEPDGHAPGAGLTLLLWPGDLTLSLGRVDYHGRWVEWAAPAP